MSGRIPSPPRRFDGRDALLLVLVVGLALVAVGNWVRGVSTEAFAAYIGTLVATFVGVGVAAYLNVRAFYAQGQRNNDERTDLLAQSLAGELFTVLDILGAGPNVVVSDPTGRNNHVPVVYAQLEPTATEEAIRVGLFGAQSTANLGQLSNLMRDYSKACDNLYPLVTQMRMNPTHPAPVAAAYPLALEITRLKMNLVIWCMTVLYGLAAQGVTMPENPQFRTEPSNVVTYKPGGPSQGSPPGTPQGPPDS